MSSLTRHVFRSPHFTKTSHARYTTTARAMAQPATPASEAISQAAKQEGGPAKGSLSAEMQSQVGKTRNFEEAVDHVGSKMQTDPGAVTSADASHLKSREARATGQAQPPPDSISADAERLAAMNEGATKRTGPNAAAPTNDPVSQSAADRLSNFESVAEDVASKMATEPGRVNKEEADLLHSREQRAFGETSKGGIASQAQSLAAENQQKGTI